MNGLSAMQGLENRLAKAEAELAVLRASQQRYRALFDSIDEGFCVIEMLFDGDGRPMDYRFLESNPAFARQTGLGDPIGRTVREMVPDHEQHWFDIYSRIALTGQPERFEEKADALGRWYDVYAFRVDAPEQHHVAVLFHDVMQQRRADANLRASEERLRALVGTAAAFIYRMSPDWRLMYELDSLDFLATTTEPIANWEELYILAEDRPLVTAAIAEAIRTRSVFALEHRLTLADGSVGWVGSRAVPILDTDGEIVEWFGSGVDITLAKNADALLRANEDRLRMLVAELQHRVRNILTVVRSIFTHSSTGAIDADDMVDHFKGRLDSLARTQVIVTQNAAGTADLENLIREELISVGVSDGPNVSIGGPDVMLPSKVAEALGLAIHELTTNALKYGALKVATGRLGVTWHTDPVNGGGRRLVFTWTEQGVPAVPVEPTRQGFGSELIRETLPHRLGADTRLEFLAGGVRCSISLPLS